MTKKIYFEPAGRIHSSQWNLINYPPEGYEFVVDKASMRERIITSDFFLFKTRRFWDRLLPTTFIKARLEGLFKEIPPDIDLVYSYNHPVFYRKPWVVIVEWGCLLIGHDARHFQKYRGRVERMLASDYCKGILVWSEPAKKALLLELNCAEFEHKIEVVPQVVTPKDFVKNYDDNKVRLLFVGSAAVPQDFELKGGREVLEVFSLLSQKHKDLELVVRAKAPPQIKEEYQEVLRQENVRLIEDNLPWELLEREFKQADIFLYPSRELHNTVILDAMSYELPIITTKVGSTGRIEDKVTGFVMQNSPDITYIPKRPAHRVGSKEHKPIKTTWAIDPEVIEELMEKTSLLIENPELRRKMGKAARWEVEEGELSIKRRNEKLKRILDEATGEI